MDTPRPDSPRSLPTRRGLLSLAAVGGAVAALGGLPAFTASAAPARPAGSPMLADGEGAATELRWRAPADDRSMITQGLPVGNGRLGALVGNDPGRERLFLTDATLWTGGRNPTLDGDGQFPYGRDDFGSFTLLGKLTVDIPDHDLSAVSGYRRALDLRQGLVTASYVRSGVTYRRRVFASAPDDVIVLHLTQDGGGRYTGAIALDGTHGETTTGTRAGRYASFGAEFANGLRYGAAVTAYGSGGTVAVEGARISFRNCRSLTVVVAGGTNYAPDPATDYRAPALDPRGLARDKVLDAAAHSATTLLHTHVADHRALFERMHVSLGTSSPLQRGMDTWERVGARHTDATPDPELEAVYLQFGRYLMIAGSRGSLPLNLQGLWLDGNDPDWMGDYHTDINLQMNYWMADRAALSDCFDAFTDYCLAQLPSWTELTRTRFNDPRNRYRNSTGKLAGWTVAISTNIHGGMGWWWHPAGNAWLCNSLYEHYEFTQDRTHLARIIPMLKGACEFWEARLLTTTVTDPVTGEKRDVLVADSDWSPEHGPLDARGITYAQELVWALFDNYRTACEVLGRDAAYARTVTGLQERLHLPGVSAKTGWLEEWMSPDNLGETTHRHLSPLVQLFPGDRIRPDGSTPEAIVEGATALLTARGMESFGWANAWRALCWARLKDAENAYRLIVNNLRPSTGGANGTAPNLFDIYEVERGRGIFQIDGNFGTPAAMIEMLVYSRPGRLQLLPALPDAWAASGSITGVGVRGGFTVDLRWRNGRPTEVTVTSVGGRTTTVAFGERTRKITLTPGRSVTLRDLGR
ncbi:MULTISPECIES: glycosyl hydrolase family 95 catalytic domain-containing protein [Streptomyces]|uniref:glycosyl hydrolase family 95 catalytic domain-containing protein n=1 Tax=Streptomyces TaxID=1883 RepID=UPI000BDC1B87|nr:MULTISPECIES: glycoside hydrolase N-terminal domain-containing protein [Streptomyces]MDX2551062.1 glycoside hydrolase N-terminal domain-containing protein [Streptomyces stelliscabiei]MDX2614849.1 glycoside hydrolase N-terminal domain-containing protein [Streptomyces stelliscabiei]MDX2635551.1 glycoside hydrolase N-terminal domain-containing protein [Streptomyces stelliscabiei]MDX2666146.1 glycoside hydrolase N-terminal domain-containing protein [Streptomyces stelliscabiei]MDX2717165.1 glyco